MFRETPCSGSRVFFSLRTDRRTDITKLIVFFPNFANSPDDFEKFTMYYFPPNYQRLFSKIYYHHHHHHHHHHVPEGLRMFPIP